MSVGNSQRRKKKEETFAQFQNPKFEDIFCFCFFQEVCFIQERSRHFEELVCRLGVPFSSPGKRKVRALESGTELPTRARGHPGSLLSRRSERPLTAAFCSWRGSAIPLKGVSRCARNGHKNDAGAFCVRAKVGYRGTGPVEDDEVRSKTSIDRGGNL